MTLPLPIPDSLLDEVHDLALACLSGTATPEDVARLDKLVCDNDMARHVYAQAIRDSFRLHRWAGAITTAHSGSSARNEPRGAVPVAPSPPFALLSTAIHGVVGYFASGWPMAYLLATVILGVALVVGALVPVSEPEQIARQSALPSTFGRGAGGEGRENVTHSRPVVGRITGMVDCQFVEDSGFRVQGSGLPSPAGRGAGGEGGSDGLHPSSFIPHPSSLVSLGDKFALAAGLLEITYDSGAKVILQGPVAYVVESKDGGFLSLGKLTARVENAKQQAAISKSPNLQISKLFVVRTPTATVTDLGTEFGVEVSREGNTTSHVYRGSVRLQVTSGDGNSEIAARVLRENESARVENGGDHGDTKRIKMFDLSGEPTAFVREIPEPTIKTFDLVDVVAGGDGFSGKRNRGIDPTSGRVVNALVPNAPPPSRLAGDGQYHRVTGMPFIDGVFIPNGGKGAVQVDSTGHVCDEFLGTSNTTCQYLWAGGSLLSDGVSTTIDDVDYASAGHGLLYLHANNAITFDLDAIRRADPGCKLVRFRATAANNCTDINCYADIWVLVDGKKQFQRRQINASSGGFAVLVPIRDTDRFLTLAATDGGDGVHFDYIIFGDPRLELRQLDPIQRISRQQGEH